MSNTQSSEKIIHGQGGLIRKPVPRAVEIQRAREKLNRALELVAYAQTTGITISFEKDGAVGFHPADKCEAKFIEEVTILGPFVKRIMEQKNLL